MAFSLERGRPTPTHQPICIFRGGRFQEIASNFARGVLFPISVRVPRMLRCDVAKRCDATRSVPSCHTHTYMRTCIHTYVHHCRALCGEGSHTYIYIVRASPLPPDPKPEDPGPGACCQLLGLAKCSKPCYERGCSPNVDRRLTEA